MGSRAGKSNVTIKVSQEINRIYNQGYSMGEVGKMLRLSRSTVCKHVWNPRPQGTQVEMRSV